MAHTTSKMLRYTALSFAAWAATPAHALELLVPGYFYPSTHVAQWQSLVETAQQQPLSVIINPNSGPGSTVNSDYQAVIADLHAAGATLYGYVSTAWGTRDLSAVTADLDAFNSMYDIDGFFLDEMATGTNMLGHYSEISDHITDISPALRTIANPGTTADEGYLALFDTLVAYESSAAALGSHTPASYQRNYTADRFAQLVYGANEATMQSLVNQAAANNYGYILVTDIDGAGAWEGLPGYWTSEAAAVQAVSTVPEPGSVALFVSGLALVAGISRRRQPGQTRTA